MRLDKDDYQLGKAKVFMRESQKQKLDTTLHQTILSRIIVIQRWYRARHQRHYFVRLRAAVLRIQTQIRCWLATQKLHQLRMQHQAAICIQRMWRGYRVRLWYQSVRSSIVRIQARFRGNQARERFTSRLEEWRTTRKRLREESLSMGSICTQLSELPIDPTGEASSPPSTPPPAVVTGVVPTAEPHPQIAPPPRRRTTSSSNQAKELSPKRVVPHLERLMSDPSVGMGSRKSLHEVKLQQHPDLSRRRSETAILDPQRRLVPPVRVSLMGKVDYLLSKSLHIALTL